MIKSLPVIILIFTILGCGPVQQKSENEIILWEMEDAQIAPYIDSTLSSFKDYYYRNHGIKLNISRTHYQGEDLRQQFQAASLAGVPPDLLISPSDTAGLYAISGFIRNLENEIDFSRYNKPVIEAITLENKIWGVPISNGNHLMLFYNKKFSPLPPQDTAALFSFCQSNRSKFDYCLAFDMGEPFWLMPWLGAYGGWPLNDRKPSLDTDAMRRTLNFYLSLKYDKKIVPPECDYNCMDSLFKEEKAPFIINGDWAISSYAATLGQKFGIALIPRLSETGLWPSPMISGKYFLISSSVQGKKLEILRELMEFYTNKENQIRQYKELKRLPALREASADREITSDPVSSASMQQILKGRPMPMAVEMRAVWDTVRNYQGLATTKKMSVEEASRKMQENVEKKIEEMNR
ncbi:MAG: maltose/maltodextrin ABC transporter substrate-binding protein MalE [Elusimicrobiota bacterium]